MHNTLHAEMNYPCIILEYKNKNTGDVKTNPMKKNLPESNVSTYKAWTRHTLIVCRQNTYVLKASFPHNISGEGMNFATSDTI